MLSASEPGSGTPVERGWTVMVKNAVDELPLASVAEKMTVLTPTANSDPLGLPAETASVPSTMSSAEGMA